MRLRYKLAVGEASDAALREVCTELLGPLRASDGPGSEADWQPTIMGLVKRNLLKSVLQQVASQRRHQRLVAEFSEQLKATEEDQQEAMES